MSSGDMAWVKQTVKNKEMGRESYSKIDEVQIIILNQLMPVELRNIKGGGLHYVADYESPETKLFRAGLKHYRPHEDRLIKGTRRSPNHDYHDHIDYERGCIIHSRSNSNQHFNFHYMYGGFKKWVVDRYIVGSLYRNGFRVMWMPALTFYIYGCYCMRQYDNAAHDFFYFSD